MPAVTNADIEDVQNASDLQLGMLYTSLGEPNSGHYIEQFALEFSTFQPDKMQLALDELISRRRSLRSFFVWREQDEARIVTLQSAQTTLKQTNFADIDVLLATDRAQELRLDQPPPMRVTYASRSDGFTHCILTFHHACVDGWSIATLTDELLKLYGCYLNEQPLPPANPDPKLQPKPNSEHGERFWQQYLAQAPAHQYIQALVTEGEPGQPNASQAAELNATLASAMTDWCKQQRITMSCFLHVAWAMTLMQLSGRQDSLFGSIDNGRGKIEHGESAVGMFMSVLPARIDATSTLDFAMLVQQFQRNHWESLEHLPPTTTELQKIFKREPGSALFDNVLIVQNYPQPRGWDDIELLSICGHEQADVPLVVSIGIGDTIPMLFRYQGNVVSAESIKALSGIFESAINTMLGYRSGQQTIDLLEEISNSTQTTIGQQSAIANDSNISYQDLRCVEQFARMTQKHPNKIALTHFTAQTANSPKNETVLSYADLSKRAESIRCLLVARGICSGDIVGIQLPRSSDAIASMLAILAMDCTYVILDPNYPESRIQEITKLAQPKAIIDSPFLADLPTETSTDALLELTDTFENQNMCLIYTSGSTGVPKGIFLTHQAVSNRLKWYSVEYPIEAGDVFCIRTPLSFVDSVCEIFTPLQEGANAVVIDDATLHSLRALRTTIQQQKVTRILLVPSLLQALLTDLEQSGEALPKLKLCVVSGEAFSTTIAEKFKSTLPNCRLVNFYGSTEIAGDALFHEVDFTAKSKSPLIPIGRPIHNMQARVINSAGYPLPAMCIGELMVSGVGVALGYHSADIDAQSKFIGQEFRTGDLAHIDGAGVIHYHGRIDRQVQIRGQRVEPAEVERELVSIPGVATAAVLLHKANLVAAFTHNEDKSESMSIAKIQSILAEKLPAHCTPNRLIEFPRLPLLINGKVDYTKLLEEIERDTPKTQSVISLNRQQYAMANIVSNTWQELIGQDDISLADNFFSIGGDSLMAMSMIAMLERSLQREIPLALLIDNPILSDFAQALCTDSSAYTQSDIFTLREGIAEQFGSILCVHGDAYNLVAQVADKRPIYWLSQWRTRMSLIKNPAVLPHEAIEQTASRYLDYLKGVSLGEHVTIVAACGAAVIAMEIARLLKNENLTIELVLMDLPGGQLSRLAAKPGSAKPHKISNEVQPNTNAQFKESENIGTSEALTTSQGRTWMNKLTGRPDVVVKRIVRAIQFRFKNTFAYQRAVLRRFDEKAAKGLLFTDVEAQRYCSYRLNNALSEYKGQPLHDKVKVVFSKDWRNKVEHESMVKLPGEWPVLLPNVTHFHFSPANHHNDLLQGEGAKFIGRLLSL